MNRDGYRELLRSGGFQCFLWTQFLGALNDNLYKIIVSMLAVDLAVSTGSSRYLSLTGAVFILPFLLFSGHAGWLADRFSKRQVLVVTKSMEILAMSLAIGALVSRRMDFLLGVLFLMALQATLFSPAKYAILPELLPEKDLSRANGLLEMSTFMAIILGTSLGSVLLASWRGRPVALGLVLLAIAIAGSLASLGIPRTPQGDPTRRCRPWHELGEGLRRLANDRPLGLAVLGMSWFWFLGALLQMDILLLGKQVMGITELQIGILVTFLATGIGLGGLAAGRLSGDKVEPGLVPIGSVGMGAFLLLLAHSARSYAVAAASLTLLGFSGGLFIVPLNALLQQKAESRERGRLMGVASFLTTVGMLLASATIWILRDLLHVPPDRILALAGWFTLAATVYTMYLVPEFLVRFIFWTLTHTLYRIRIVGTENVPSRGPALLVSNHVSFADGQLVGACLQRFVRFLVFQSYYEKPGLHCLFRLMKAIPIAGGNRREVVQSLARARREIEAGHVVCIFAEGAISRTGNLLRFKRGFERIVDGLDVPVIPVHLDRVWGSIFSYEHGRFFRKWPRHIPYPVTVSFGHPLPAGATAWDVRQAVQELGTAAWDHRHSGRDLLHLHFIRTAKRRWRSLCMADSSGKELTFGRTLTAGLLLAGWLRKNRQTESNIGLLLPASVGGALANLAVMLAGKVPVNLNFTAGSEAMGAAIEQCGLRTIFTSRTFLAKAKLDQREGMVFLEDVLRGFSPGRKALAAAVAFLTPSRLLEAACHHGETPDSVATVIFSSGSTGRPKGVRLSHHNVLSNIEAIREVFAIQASDRFLGALPFFHSFGFTVTLWLPLVEGFGAVYHPNPLEAKAVGEMAAKYGATIMTATPTFYAAYLKRCTREEFATLRLGLVGAEKLRASLAAEFKEKYGVELLEGYGATEMAPVVAVNTPDVEQGSEHQTGTKPGTVGHPLPGVSVRVVDPATRELLGPDQEGLLLVKGPNRMLGYLGDPGKTAEVFDHGWYVTGDIGCVDEEGFIRLTDRLSRFSKIGGEMVPHLRLEEAISVLLIDATCVVTAVPDEQKGERLVVLHTDATKSGRELWEALSQNGLPRLWLPRADNIVYVEAIPTLGTGKVDLRRVREMAHAVIA